MSIDEKLDLWMDELIAIGINDASEESIGKLISTLEAYEPAQSLVVDYSGHDTIDKFIRWVRNDGSWPFIITMISVSDGLKKLSACNKRYFEEDKHAEMMRIPIDEFLKEGKTECVSVEDFDSVFE